MYIVYQLLNVHFFAKVITMPCNTYNYPQTLLNSMCMYNSCEPERLSDFPKVTQLVKGGPSLDPGFKTPRPVLFLL